MSALDVQAVIEDLKRRRQLLDDAITALTAYQEGHVNPAARLGDSVRLMRPPFEVKCGQIAAAETGPMYLQNPAPDAAAPAVPSGVCGVATITR